MMVASLILWKRVTRGGRERGEDINTMGLGSWLSTNNFFTYRDITGRQGASSGVYGACLPPLLARRLALVLDR